MWLLYIYIAIKEDLITEVLIYFLMNEKMTRLNYVDHYELKCTFTKHFGLSYYMNFHKIFDFIFHHNKVRFWKP